MKCCKKAEISSYCDCRWIQNGEIVDRHSKSDTTSTEEFVIEFNKFSLIIIGLVILLLSPIFIIM